MKRRRITVWMCSACRAAVQPHPLTTIYRRPFECADPEPVPFMSDQGPHGIAVKGRDERGRWWSGFLGGEGRELAMAYPLHKYTCPERGEKA